VGLWTRKIAPWSIESPESSKRLSLESSKYEVIIKSDEALAARPQPQHKSSAQAVPATGHRQLGRLTPEAQRIGEMIERETMKRGPAAHLADEEQGGYQAAGRGLLSVITSWPTDRYPPVARSFMIRLTISREHPTRLAIS